MKPIYNEEEVSRLAAAFAKKTTEKLKSDLLDGIYQDISDYLYEHYQNFQDKIEGDLINSICEKYVKEPTEYKYADLRKKMFNENKEELTKVLTDEAIEKSVEDVIEQYTHRDYHFNWKWEDGIAKVILRNIDKFAESKRIQEVFKRENDRLNETNKYLQNQIDELKEVLN